MTTRRSSSEEVEKEEEEGRRTMAEPRIREPQRWKRSQAGTEPEGRRL
jgi:hypothetical protein